MSASGRAATLSLCVEEESDVREFAAGFYKSQAWKDARAAYVKYAGGLCEVCLAKGLYNAGEIVHHKIHITPANIGNPSITLSFNNLQLVCRECHAAIHDDKTSGRRYTVDASGRVTPR